MVFGVNLIYLLILVAVSLGLILGTRALQKSALAELSHTLYVDNDPETYARMLNSRFLSLVLRRGTVALLKLDGALFSGVPAAVWEVCALLEGIKKLKQEERLNWYQKALSFAVMRTDKQHAEAYLTRLVRFLEKEPDESLKAIVKEAKQLYGVYIEKDAALIDELEKDAAVFDGARRGLVLYRLAKLHHFEGDDEKAAGLLNEAAAGLKGNPWFDVAERALADHSVLDTE